MDIMSTNSLRSKMQESVDAKRPERSVATNGVLNVGWTYAKNLKIRPSQAIAYKTLGIGNTAPIKLVDSPANAPTVTIHFAHDHPSCSKT